MTDATAENPRPAPRSARPRRLTSRSPPGLSGGRAPKPLSCAHSLENLGFHHFKYAQFLRPGDVHVHFFGTATLSFADGVRTRPGDRFEIGIAAFGEPLTNGIAPTADALPPGAIGRR